MVSNRLMYCLWASFKITLSMFGVNSGINHNINKSKFVRSKRRFCFLFSIPNPSSWNFRRRSEWMLNVFNNLYCRVVYNSILSISATLPFSTMDNCVFIDKIFCFVLFFFFYFFITTNNNNWLLLEYIEPNLTSYWIMLTYWFRWKSVLRVYAVRVFICYVSMFIFIISFILNGNTTSIVAIWC